MPRATGNQEPSARIRNDQRNACAFVTSIHTPPAPLNVGVPLDTPSEPDSQPFASAKPQTILRHLLERFALIAFALYHLPLFLNNYPSLGGGGAADHGLAVSWGHVFTPPGVWLARHLFHMHGPMPYAYQGDNGDVGEEFGRLLLAIAIAILGALAWTLVDRRRNGGRWVGETLRVLLRYSIALGLTSYAIGKIWREQFPPLQSIVLDQRLGDLSPMSLLWSFMQYSRLYSTFGGVMEFAVVLLLCFRRTATLGALLCLGVMSNVALLNIAYDVQVKLYSTMIVVSAAVLVLYDAPRLYAFFVRNRAVAPTPESPLHRRISRPLRWTIKVLLVGSVMISSAVVARSASATRSDTASPLAGGWTVTAFQSASSSDSPRWRRFFGNDFGLGIRFDNDSLLVCRRDASSNSATLALSCPNGAKGLLEWTRAGDLLQLRGTFDGAPFTASARHLEESDYRLLRTRSRLIYDR